MKHPALKGHAIATNEKRPSGPMDTFMAAFFRPKGPFSE